MSIIEGNKETAVDLRLLVEDSLKSNLISIPINPSEADWQRVVLELRVHQIELEMQNDELVKSKEVAYAAVKQAEIAIEKYTELYDFAPSGYFTLSKDGIILDINFRAARMINKKRSLLKNSSFGFFVSNDTKKIYNNFIINTFDSNITQSCDVTLLLDNRSPMYIQLSGIVIDNKEQCLVNVVDITEHKQVEQLLKQTRMNYETFFNSSNDLYFILDASGNILQTNTTVVDRLGFPTKELTGKSINILNPQENCDESSLILGKMLSGITMTTPFPFFTKQGIEVPVETRVTAGIWNGLPVVFWVSKEITT